MSRKGTKNFRPRYDRRKKTWRVDFEDRDSEEGGLLYVAGEFAKTGLYFPYNDSGTKGREYPGHAHSFEGVLHALLDDPAGWVPHRPARPAKYEGGKRFRIASDFSRAVV